MPAALPECADDMADSGTQKAPQGNHAKEERDNFQSIAAGKLRSELTKQIKAKRKEKAAGLSRPAYAEEESGCHADKQENNEVRLKKLLQNGKVVHRTSLLFRFVFRVDGGAVNRIETGLLFNLAALEASADNQKKDYDDDNQNEDDRQSGNQP